MSSSFFLSSEILINVIVKINTIMKDLEIDFEDLFVFSETWNKDFTKIEDLITILPAYLSDTFEYLICYLKGTDDHYNIALFNNLVRLLDFLYKLVRDDNKIIIDTIKKSVTIKQMIKLIEKAKRLKDAELSIPDQLIKYRLIQLLNKVWYYNLIKFP